MTHKLSSDAIETISQSCLRAVGQSQEDFQQQLSRSQAASPRWPGRAWAPQNAAELAQFIDHTLLKADATPQQVDLLCDEALQHQFASVCVNSCYVLPCAARVKDTAVKVCSVVGFPLGASATQSKAAETAIAIEAGASEIDMVINVGHLKSVGLADLFSHGTPDSAVTDFPALIAVFDDIKAVVDAAWGKPVKVILETCLLDAVEIIAASTLAVAAGADFVKTSTGFSTGGATIQDVELMRSVVGSSLGVKASGGIRTAAAGVQMIQAGANRIGTSNGVAIVSGPVAS